MNYEYMIPLVQIFFLFITRHDLWTPFFFCRMELDVLVDDDVPTC
jgi:hypothetical protein